MSPCVDPRFEEMLHAYELRLIDDEDRQQLELHLLECEHCYQKVRRLESAMALVRDDQAIRERVIESVPEEPAVKTRIPASRMARFAVAAAIIFVAGVSLFRVLSQDEQPPQVQQTILLISTRSADTPSLARAEGGLAAIRFVYEDAAMDRAYDITIQTREGTVVLTWDGFSQFNDQGLGEWVVPIDQLEPGPYVLRIGPAGAPGAETLRQFSFRVK